MSVVYSFVNHRVAVPPPSSPQRIDIHWFVLELLFIEYLYDYLFNIQRNTLLAMAEQTAN